MSSTRSEKGSARWGLSSVAATTVPTPVRIAVRQDGDREPLGSGFVMGGANGERGPFDGTLTFRAPTVASGAIVLSTASMENGVREATVVRVQFALANA